MNQFRSVHKREGSNCAQVNFLSSRGHLEDVPSELVAGTVREDEEKGVEINRWKTSVLNQREKLMGKYRFFGQKNLAQNQQSFMQQQSASSFCPVPKEWCLSFNPENILKKGSLEIFFFFFYHFNVTAGQKEHVNKQHTLFLMVSAIF